MFSRFPEYNYPLNQVIHFVNFYFCFLLSRFVAHLFRVVPSGKRSRRLLRIFCEFFVLLAQSMWFSRFVPLLINGNRVRRWSSWKTQFLAVTEAAGWFFAEKGAVHGGSGRYFTHSGFFFCPFRILWRLFLDLWALFYAFKSFSELLQTSFIFFSLFEGAFRVIELGVRYCMSLCEVRSILVFLGH